MLANGLLCPDLINAPQSYKGVIFYFDTPLIIRRFGLEGEVKKDAIEELISLLHHLGASTAVFSHTRDEIERVISGASEYIDNLAGRGAIVTEARRMGRTKSDLLLLANKTDELLEEAQVEVKKTPSYDESFQIDQTVFEQVLDEELSYLNPYAKADDVNSVRSIYALRVGQSPSSLERCKAVLVTSNAAFSRAANDYGPLCQ